MKKVLVTGAHGFIGKNLISLLKSKGFSLTCFLGDIRKNDEFPEDTFDAIIHLAALISHKGSLDFQKVRDVNVNGTKNLLAAFPDTKFIYISTTDVTRQNLNDYEQSKFDAEKAVLEANQKNLIIRLASVFGPYQKQDKLIPRLFQHFISGTPVEIKNDDERQYIFVEDVANQIFKHLESKGTMTLPSLAIRNRRLEKLIESVCKKTKMELGTEDEKNILEKLKLCLPSYLAFRKKIFFDLDGTLLDISEKYYTVYSDFLKENNITPLSKKEYWEKKREKNTDEEFVGKELAKNFKKFFLEKVEEEKYLEHDKLILGTLETLEELSKTHDIFIVTLRRKKKNLYRELESFGLDKFKLIHGLPATTTGHNFEKKITLLEKYVVDGDTIVGDSSAEVKAGKALRLKTVGVLSGLSSRKVLETLAPDAIVEDVKSAAKLLQ